MPRIDLKRRRYNRDAPSVQATVDIFRGKWSSQLPRELGVRAGSVPLFEDERVTWAIEQLGGVEHAKVLELGPLEGGHTYQVLGAGAGRVTAVEASVDAYLRCLVVKEVLGLTDAHFLLGDIVEYLRQDEPTYDLCVASGVLYHLTNPVEALALIARRAKQLFLWTHYYDAALTGGNARLIRRSRRPAIEHEHEGFRHKLHPYQYGLSLRSSTFCGGTANHGRWLERADLLGALAHVGFEVTSIGFDDPAHRNGPAIAIVARRTSDDRRGS